MCRSPHLHFLRIFHQRCVKKSLAIAVPSAALTAVIKVTDRQWDYLKLAPHTDAFKLFAGTVSLLVVFRTVQSLSRYNDGAKAAYHMTGAWFEAASTLFAFTRGGADSDKVRDFKNTMIRLFSLMSMLCLEELENCKEGRSSRASNFIVIDVEGLDPAMMEFLKTSKCKAESVCQFIQCVIVDSIGTGVLALPPPILSRAFQTLGGGMLKYHETLAIARVSVPFPLTAVCDCLGLIYAIIIPVVMSLWFERPVGAFLLTLIQVSVIYSLIYLAHEVENPFSGRFHDMDMESIHHQMNIRLASLNVLSYSNFGGQLGHTGQGDLCRVSTLRHSSFSGEISPDVQSRRWSFSPAKGVLGLTSSEVKKEKEITEDTTNRIDGVLDRFLVRGQTRAEKHLEQRVREIESLLSAAPATFHHRHQRVSDQNSEGNREGPDTSIMPTTLERPASPELDYEVGVEVSTCPTFRLTVNPCSAPVQKSLMKSRHREGNNCSRSTCESI